MNEDELQALDQDSAALLEQPTEAGDTVDLNAAAAEPGLPGEELLHDYDPEALAQQLKEPEPRSTGEKIAGSVLPAVLGGLAAAAVGAPVGLFALTAGKKEFDKQGIEDDMTRDAWLDLNRSLANDNMTYLRDKEKADLLAKSRSDEIELQDKLNRERIQLENDLKVAQAKKDQEAQVRLQAQLDAKAKTDATLTNTRADINAMTYGDRSSVVSDIGKEYARQADAILSQNATGELSDEETAAGLNALNARYPASDRYRPDYAGSEDISVAKANDKTLATNQTTYKRYAETLDSLERFRENPVSYTRLGFDEKLRMIGVDWGGLDSQTRSLFDNYEANKFDIVQALAPNMKPVSDSNIRLILDSLAGSDVNASISALRTGMVKLNDQHTGIMSTARSRGAGYAEAYPDYLTDPETLSNWERERQTGEAMRSQGGGSNAPQLNVTSRVAGNNVVAPGYGGSIYSQSERAYFGGN